MTAYVCYRYRPSVMFTALAVWVASYYFIYDIGGLRAVGVTATTHLAVFVLDRINHYSLQGEHE